MKYYGVILIPTVHQSVNRDINNFCIKNTSIVAVLYSRVLDSFEGFIVVRGALFGAEVT